VEQFGAAIVFEPTEACSRPRPPLRFSIVSSVSDAWIVGVLLKMNKTDSSFMLQFCTIPGMWRDCMIAGPAASGEDSSLSVIPRYRMQGEQATFAQDVSVRMIRIADFADEEEFFLQLKLSQSFKAPASIGEPTPK
jgi:hypothetical protein